jgi:hypothetical protein
MNEETNECICRRFQLKEDYGRSGWLPSKSYLAEASEALGVRYRAPLRPWQPCRFPMTGRLVVW